MREVAVAGLGFFVGLVPFEEATIGRDGGWGKFCETGANAGDQGRFDFQDFGSFERVGECFPDDLMIHRGAH